MKYNYNNIIRSVSVNIGNNSPNQAEVSIIKKDIFDTITNVYTKAKPVKDLFKKKITSKISKVAMPENFLLADEVIFTDINGKRFSSKEITQEKYLRWSPDISVTDTNFEVEMLSNNPESFILTEENTELDGYIGYYFSDENDMSVLNFKPSINGEVEILHAVFPEDSLVEISDSPRLHKAFIKLLVLGPTIQGLLRTKPDNEIIFADKTLRLKMYSAEYKEMLSDFAGYINRTTNTPVVEPFNFLNFYDDIIYG